MYAALMVIVEPDGSVALSTTTLSWAKGKLLLLTAPPEDKAQLPEEDQRALELLARYTVLAASNVIPLLPLQSPKRVPDTGAAAPAMMMSRKSMSVGVATAAQVSVRVVPRVLDCTNVRIVALVPAESVRVPLIVWLADKTIAAIPAEVLPATVRLLKVFEPLMMGEIMPEFVKLTLYKVWLLKSGEELVPVKSICDVPALKVSEARIDSAVPKLAEPDSVSVDDPKLTVLALLLFAIKLTQVRLKFAVSNAPLVTVKDTPVALKALPSVHSAPTPFTVIGEERACPLVVSVRPADDPDSVIAPVYVLVKPVAGSVTLP